MRVMAGVAVELHRRIRRDLNLDGFSDRVFGRLEMRNIKGAVS